MVACSVVTTVLILNVHKRTVDTHEVGRGGGDVRPDVQMPPWVETVFLQWLPWVLRMERPGKPLTAQDILLK